MNGLLVEKARQLGVGCSVDLEGRIEFDDEEWCRVGDPHILTLDDEFGPMWVAVYTADPIQREERASALTARGVKYQVWFDASGTSLVLDKRDCPADWEYA